jgi:hypothetical protein
VHDLVLGILGEDANVRAVNHGNVVVKCGKGNPVCVIRAIKEQISRLEEEANWDKAQPI